ncbi:ComEA family DNA-binding protein [Hymenobacter rubripertinctus]|uniref:Helix-hairpin-helix domain-containing protein n=1 Tax=Hymenobacter rubripertinctus TaxID=2029981 RepID=A0A418R346_9BACT|nr:helix-hairpin-helix domain-containing protein [Hymenobacter rubripertinctus]RIY11761.1 helix-hairpin-helix domain-containing protein [Hymenobacter rubripertinctus]
MAASRPKPPVPASVRRFSVAARARRAVRRYFGFSRRETSGFVVLLLLLGLWLALPALLRPALPTYNPAPDQRRLDAWATALAARRTARPAFVSRYPRRSYAARERVPQVPLAAFDPNTFSARDWQARGLPAWLAERLVKYRAAVGGFRAKEQLRKAYGLSDTTYARLAPYLQLPDQLPPREPRSFVKGENRFPERKPFEARPGFAAKPRNLVAFDLNAADTTQLMQIRGIGRGYARRVVEYRQRLGGFRQANQLAEIYALHDAPDLVDSLRKYTFVAPGFAPALLDVNTASFEVLQAHPYVGKRLARVLVAYRQQHGPFQQPTDLRKIRVLDEATFDKMLPYIVVR